MPLHDSAKERPGPQGCGDRVRSYIASLPETPSASIGGVTRSRLRRTIPRLEPAFHASELALAMLDKLHRGVILLDAYGIVCHVNAAASRMLKRGCGLQVSGLRMTFTFAQNASMFQRFLTSGICSDGTGSLVLRTGATAGESVYRVLISPLPKASGALGRAGYCVAIYEPERGAQPLPVTVLTHLYGLTPGQARLANELFIGRDLLAAAQSLRISRNTARSVLKTVFAKCAVSSQAELLQLLSLGPRAL